MSEPLRILYVGETWKGSSARSMREALAALPDVRIDEVAEDHYTPRHRGRLLRGINRLLRPLQIRELEREVLARLATLKPHAMVVYKGNTVGPELVRAARRLGIAAINIFPDATPHGHGEALRRAIGEYDLVVSTKPFHPRLWLSVYGYSNACRFVPHGFDPAVHLWDEPAGEADKDFDVVVAASWRPQYERFLLDFWRKADLPTLRVGVAGQNWPDRRARLPGSWVLPGALNGRAYGEWLRRGRIAIAPLHREVRIGGTSQPGDEDTTRTYELAAACCFFVHRRTPYLETIYDERTEVPLFDSPEELSRLISHYLPRAEERARMARAAHARAVPAYSIPSRAREVLTHIRELLGARGRLPR